MILLDANVLLYAYNVDSELYRPARSWLGEALTASEQVGFSWMVMLAFLRISTHPRIFEQPLSTVAAIEVVSSWLAHPTAEVLEAGPGHWAILQDMLTQGQVREDLIMDAHLAALAIEHGATLCTTDRDFTRFPGLRLLNPLEPPHLR